MATYQLPAVECFDFGKPGDWPSWVCRFERFREASGLKEKEEEAQVSALIYMMGDKAEDILRSFGLKDEDKKKYKVVRDRYEAYFVKKRNVIYERAKFNLRKQEDGEPVDDFVTSLYSLAQYCNFGDLHDEMIRDRLVVGLRDANLSEKLQLDSELTLEKAIAMARQSESVKLQQATVRGEQKIVNVELEAVSVKQRLSKLQTQSGGTESPSGKKCFRCGRFPPHAFHQCPARNIICHRCGKRGHFQSHCQTPSTDISTVSKQSGTGFVSILDAGGERPWFVTLQLQGISVRFKTDTGADVTVIPESVFKRIRNANLMHSDRILCGPAKNALHVIGQFNATLKHRGGVTSEEVYVVRGLQTPLIGLPAIKSLGLVVRVCATESGDYATRILNSYPDLFTGLGTLGEEYKICLRPHAQPFALYTPRRVALPLMNAVKEELERMVELGVIRPVQEATEWCAGMVVVPKADGKIRICVDFTKLNESVCRELHMLPCVEQILAQLSGAKMFSKLDANSGFWQIKLSESSSPLTTFITPFGRFCFQRLPFGITSAPEIFQKRMSEILLGLDGVVCMMDDVLIFGPNQEIHDMRLKAVLQRVKSAGVTLNRDKCVFSQSSVKFLGQIVDAQGVRPDPNKVTAIRGMAAPMNTTELRRYLGMINQLSKFTPNIAELTKPLRELLSKKNEWTWNEIHQKAFSKLKDEVSTQPVLALYSPKLDTIVSADASSYGIGAVLLQRQLDGSVKPVSYASRSLTPTEQKYAQIEKEALGVTWACERFRDFLTGLQFQIETDHKPLVPLLGSNNLEDLPLRVQRFRLRLMRFKYTISHIPGKELVIADTLSRAPSNEVYQEEKEFRAEIQAYVDLVVRNIPTSEPKMLEIKQAQQKDEICQKVIQYCQEGWPDKSLVKGEWKQFFHVASELSIQDGLLLRGNRIVIPMALRAPVLNRLHEGHLGINKCRDRARESVWWPGLNTELEVKISMCTKCIKSHSQKPEPLMMSKLPDLPWQKVATDLFSWKGSQYLLIIDYFSRYVELSKLSATTSQDVINHMKSIFARHGIPNEVVSDNGPQFSSNVFHSFAGEYGFVHTTSSPRYPQGNGEAERAVRTIKNILDKAKDPYLGLLAYRSTPLRNGYSPSELLMNRRLRTTVPTLGYNLHPSVPNYAQLRAMEQKDKQKQKTDFDRRHASRSLQQLMPGDQVWIDDRNLRGSVVKEYSPRSYLVDTERGILRRNRRQLKFLPGVKDHSHSAIVHNGGGVSSTDPVPHNVVILRDEEETPREQQEAAVDPQEQERTLQVPEESVESHEQEEAVGQQELEGVVEPQVQGHESEGQYEAPNNNNPNASGSHKQQELVQPRPVITKEWSCI